jgi:hypothetical protein
MNGRSRAGEVIYFISLDIKREADIMAHNLEAPVIEEVNDICAPTCIEVVHAQYLMAGLKESFTEVGPKKSGTSRDNYSFA